METDYRSIDFCDENSVHRDAVAIAQKEIMKSDRIERAAGMFRVFGDGTRARILCALSVTELCVCDLADLLHMTVSAISHQLRLMKDMRLVKCRRDGKTVFYSLADEHIVRIFQLAFEHIAEEEK